MSHATQREVVEVLREYIQPPVEVEVKPVTDEELEQAVNVNIELLNLVVPDDLMAALRKHFPSEEAMEAFMVGVSLGLQHRPRFVRRCPAHHGFQPHE